jgi:hypothetical protein
MQEEYVKKFLLVWRLLTVSPVIDTALAKFLGDDVFSQCVEECSEELLDFLSQKHTTPLVDILALAVTLANVYLNVVLKGGDKSAPEFAYLATLFGDSLDEEVTTT